MENKVCAKPMYKCAVCGEVYDSIAQRMNCEQACLKRQEAEYNARIEEVNAAFEKAYKLRDKLVADYGEYYYSHRFENLDSVFKELFGI